MSNQVSDNKRIAKNAILMYIRMGITMVVGLYTSRIVLQQLGVEDYGLYNVIGGIIAMFGFLNGSMINATSRFITFYLAKNDSKMLNNIFSMTFLIHLCIGILILILGETVGLYYLNNNLVIPEGRDFAAHWLYQLSVLSCFISILYVPYNAIIIAHEKMNAFAYIAIMDVLLKLVIVLLLAYSPFDKLLFYATLLTCVSLLDFLIYFTYCHRKFVESKLKFYWNQSIFKEMLSFVGWALVGNFSFLFYSQGINLMLNAFCGPAVNAARGIAVQVEGVVKQFANNIQVAINPQIIKSYASNEMDRMYSLIFASSRLCFYLLFIISLPIMIEADFILKLWLGQVPEHTVNFIRIILSITLLDAFINPLFTANLASGKLKTYNLSVCSISYPFMIITYLSIKYTGIPESVFISLFISTTIGVVVRVFVLYKQIGMSPQLFFKQVVERVLGVIILSPIIPVLLHNLIECNWKRCIGVSFTSIFTTIIAVYYIGLREKEREFIISKVKAFKNDSLIR